MSRYPAECPAFYWSDPEVQYAAGVYTGRASNTGKFIFLDNDYGEAIWLVSPEKLEPLTEAAKDVMLCALGMSWGQP